MSEAVESNTSLAVLPTQEGKAHKHILPQSLTAEQAWPQKGLLGKSTMVLAIYLEHSGMGCSGAQNYPIANGTSWSSDTA